MVPRDRIELPPPIIAKRGSRPTAEFHLIAWSLFARGQAPTATNSKGRFFDQLQNAKASLAVNYARVLRGLLVAALPCPPLPGLRAFMRVHT
jgi:hypothetical protein